MSGKRVGVGVAEVFFFVGEADWDALVVDLLGTGAADVGVGVGGTCGVELRHRKKTATNARTATIATQIMTGPLLTGGFGGAGYGDCWGWYCPWNGG